jgi:transcriptional antiterminator RfaH
MLTAHNMREIRKFSGPAPLTSRWYVVQTQTHSETKAMGHLIQQGFNVYLPRYLKRRSHARKVEVVAAPLFPRYLFVAVDVLTPRLRSIRSTVGVSRLVCNGDEPAAVPPERISELKQREDAAGYIKLDERPRFAPGDRVRVVHGRFADNLGLFEGMTDQDRVAILVNMMGRETRVLLDEAAITGA